MSNASVGLVLEVDRLRSNVAVVTTFVPCLTAEVGCLECIDDLVQSNRGSLRWWHSWQCREFEGR